MIASHSMYLGLTLLLFQSALASSSQPQSLTGFHSPTPKRPDSNPTRTVNHLEAIASQLQDVPQPESSNPPTSANVYPAGTVRRPLWDEHLGYMSAQAPPPQYRPNKQNTPTSMRPGSNIVPQLRDAPQQSSTNPSTSANVRRPLHMAQLQGDDKNAQIQHWLKSLPDVAGDSLRREPFDWRTQGGTRPQTPFRIHNCLGKCKDLVNLVSVLLSVYSYFEGGELCATNFQGHDEGMQVLHLWLLDHGIVPNTQRSHQLEHSPDGCLHGVSPLDEYILMSKAQIC